MKLKRIRFQETEYWLVPSDYGGGMLSPIEHFNENGTSLFELFDISFAIIEGDSIMRYGLCIGNISEIEYLDKEP